MDEFCSSHVSTSANITQHINIPDVPSSENKCAVSPDAKSATSPSALKKQNVSPSTVLKEPHSSPRDRRRSLRRSSAKKRRRSLPPLYYNTTGLSDAISLELPECDRLSELIQSCFQFSVKKLEDSLKYTDGFDQDSFSAKVVTITQKVKRFTEKLSRDGTLKKCTEKSTCVEPNPETEALETQMKEHISKFSTECENWDQLLEDYKAKAEEISRQLEESKTTQVPTTSECYIQTSQDKVIHSKPDYRRILNQQGEVFDCMEIVLDELQESIQLLNSFLGDSSQHLQKMSAQLNSRSFKHLEDSPFRKFLRMPQK
ncbi:kinetochore-associated protein DSN1 homolog [Bombina bombina]|uniref:kinetochore-associated protein DSN1 homolog n=1 Tax=Bombina bombina TaxID=8345 RepID=UPI00235A77D1|nr:kinetochore-associated protein DSN1 homolog [Bombina bombina]XP_053573892.1 kinetochore-associated protein DSN1 homolog [Bombina bombina]